MLTLYANQLTDLETELAKLSELLEQKKQMAKALKATERKATKLIDGLRGLINELPSDANANFRESILSLFPSPQSPVTDSSGNDLPSAPAPEEIELPILKAIEDFASIGKNLEERTFQQQPEKPATDIPIASAPAELENAFSQVPLTNDTPDFIEEVQPKAEDAIGKTEIPASEIEEIRPSGWILTKEGQHLNPNHYQAAEDAITTPEAKTETPVTAINEFCSLIKLNETVAYIRSNRGQMAGEIMSAYVGCSSQKLASDWAECVKLWGATQAEVRKPQRLTDAKWEVKIWGLPFQKLTRLAEFHKSLGDPVPGASHSIEEAKKPDLNSPSSGAISGDSSDMNSKSEFEEASARAAKDAEIIAAGELAKEELGLAEAPLNDTPMQGDFVRIISGHYAGLSGEATTVSRKGGIIATEQGNRWVIWSDCEVTQKTLVR